MLLEYITPGAYVAFFEEVAARGGFGANREDLDEVAAKYGQRWIRDAEWLPGVVTRYGLRAWRWAGGEPHRIPGDRHTRCPRHLIMIPVVVN